MPDRLRPLWDFDNLDATEQRLRAQLEQEHSDAGRAEVLTQLARVQGLRDDFEGCEALLREAQSVAGDDPRVRARIGLERGRKLRSSGDAAASVSLFEDAFATAEEIGEFYLAGDAAHMVAIADATKMIEWTQRGLDLAAGEPDAAYWAGPLLNNLGWHYYDASEYESALDAFERALAVRKRDPGNPQAIEWAEKAVEETRKALGR